MDNSQVEHFQNQRVIHQKRLRKLQKQQALYGVRCPPEIQIEIEEIEKQIDDIDYELGEGQYATASINDAQNYYDSSDGSYYTLASSGPNWNAIIVVAVIIFAIGGCISNEISKNKLTESFPVSSGLGAWRTIGAISLIEEGRGEGSSLKGGVQIPAGQSAFMYQIVADTPSIGEAYKASAWCKAPLGATCKIFLGSVQEGTSFQLPDSTSTISRDGSDQWESMVVSMRIETEEPIAIFLYSEGQSGMVIYDDVSVRRE